MELEYIGIYKRIVKEGWYNSMQTGYGNFLIIKLKYLIIKVFVFLMFKLLIIMLSQSSIMNVFSGYALWI